MRWLLATAMLAASGNAGAQTVVDGSEAKLPPALLRKAITAVADQFNDPGSTQFRRLHLDAERGVNICGQVNAKNAFGGYVGFVVFVYDAYSATAVTYDLREGARAKTMAVIEGCIDAAGITDPAEIKRIKDDVMSGKAP